MKIKKYAFYESYTAHVYHANKPIYYHAYNSLFQNYQIFQVLFHNIKYMYMLWNY